MSIENTILIRRAKPDDVLALTTIAIRAKRSNGYDDFFMDACEEELSVSEAHLEQGEYWVAERDTLCGFASLSMGAEPGVGELHSLFIDPEWQRRGLGKRLWLEVRQSAKSKGIGKIQLDSDPFAVAFYESLGFKTIGSAPSASIKGRFIPRMENHI